jgi:hypothetical protein
MLLGRSTEKFLSGMAAQFALAFFAARRMTACSSFRRRCRLATDCGMTSQRFKSKSR